MTWKTSPVVPAMIPAPPGLVAHVKGTTDGGGTWHAELPILALVALSDDAFDWVVTDEFGYPMGLAEYLTEKAPAYLTGVRPAQLRVPSEP